MTEQELQEIDKRITAGENQESWEYDGWAYADRANLHAEVRRLRAACKLVVEDYDKARQEACDELCWDAFGGVGAIREDASNV